MGPRFWKTLKPENSGTLFGQESFRLIGDYAELPIELGDEVDKILEKKLLGYRSRAEFVAEAVRDKLIQVKK
jgi:hypothetical protein